MPPKPRPRLLDLFCCQGGAATGYHRAGFDVVGVDLKPQLRYPFEFHQANALEFVAAHGAEFDAIHASPPCQGYSEQTPTWARARYTLKISDVREVLARTGKPYVIENVAGARSKMVNPIMLCGTMFGLPIWRHRYFETWPFWAMSPRTCQHRSGPIVIHAGGISRKTMEPIVASGTSTYYDANGKHRRHERLDIVRTVMDCNWMTGHGLTEAIPPAYTQHIGKILLEAL